VRLAELRNIVLPNQPLFELDSRELVQALQTLPITTIHVHGTVDFDATAPAQLVALARGIGAALELDIHDYQVICPRINLADESGRYCGEPSERHCDTCLQTQGNRYGERSIRAWRSAHEGLLRAAQSIWVPDADVRERLHRYFPEISVEVLPHEDLELLRTPLVEPELSDGEPMHIVVIGAVSRIKGYELLLGCARDARARRLPLRFSVLGYSMSDAPLLQAGVEVSGRYLEGEGMQRLRGLAPHVVWLPSLWPETYSYTLSMALQGGYPVFAFDIGAIGRRLRELDRAEWLAPLPQQLDAREMNRQFLEYREQRRGVVSTVIARAVG
jgi:glycosyltransferase involved in cell wall biosynthesis